MKSKKLLALILTLVLMTALFSGCNNAPAGTPTSAPGGAGPSDSVTQEEKWDLTLSAPDGPASVKTQFLEGYAERVREATNGRVNITVFPSAVLASTAASLDAVKSKAVDIVWYYSGYVPGQFPLTDVISQPMIGIKSVAQATNVLWDLWEKYDALQEELAQYKVLQLLTNPPCVLSFGKKVVNSLETMKGAIIRTPAGTATDIVQLWGGNPVHMGPHEIYESIEKGVIDGYAIDFSGIADNRLDEVTEKYMDMYIYVGPFFLLMNKELWESFPQDIKNAIDSVSGRDNSLNMADIFQVDAEAKREAILARNNTELVLVSDADYARFKSIADNYNNEWAQKSSTDTFDAQEYLNDTITFVEKYS